MKNILAILGLVVLTGCSAISFNTERTPTSVKYTVNNSRQADLVEMVSAETRNDNTGTVEILMRKQVNLDFNVVTISDNVTSTTLVKVDWRKH